MKLFGKKGAGAETPDNSDLGEEELGAPEAAGDDLGSLDDAAVDDGLGDAPVEKTLTAPTRSLSASGGGGRRNLLVLALLAVVALGCGGYYWFMNMDDSSEPIHVTAKAPVPPADAGAPPQPAPPQPDPSAAVLGTTPAPAGTDPLAATTMPANPADPMAMPPADPAAQPDVNPAAQPPMETAATMPAPAGTDPLAPAPAADPNATLGQPPGDEANATSPAPISPAPDEMAPDMPPPTDMAAAPPAPAGTAPAVPGATPGTSTPPADLPVPADPALAPAPAATATPGMPVDPVAAATPTAAAPSAETAPSWAAPGTAAVPGTTNPVAKPSSPNDAELAIVQNAAVLDQLSRPTTGTAAAPAGADTAPTGMPFDPATSKPDPNTALKQLQQNLEVTAVRRQLPAGYMTMRKESDSGDIDSRLTAARAALSQGRSAAALELFEDMKRDYPKDKRILMGRAVSLQKLGQNDDALAAYEAVLNRDPKNLDALTNMLGLLKSKDPGLAVEKLQELRDAYPYQGDITAQLGIAYATNGQYDQAMKYLDMADSLKPGSAYVLYNKSVLLDKMGRSQDAALLYRRILRMAADGDIDQPLPLESIRNRLAVLR